MSTPLFLLEPTDSVWTAHQKMQSRHVRRLVVSWNWGSGLGIVTQTSLLKVFDPIEMYSIIESLQRTLHQIGNGPTSDLSSVMSQQAADVGDQVTDLLFDIETKLLGLSDNNCLSLARRQELIQGALRSLQQIQTMLADKRN